MELYNTYISMDIILIVGGAAMGYTEAQKEATARYNKKTYDRIDIIVPKGKRAIIKNFARKQGKSTNRFINDAIDKAMSDQEDKDA